MLLLWDLDGTITDSAPGITRSLNHALVASGGSALPDGDLRPFIGRPLAVIFETLLDPASADRVEAAVASYRERFDTSGIFENSLVPGVVDVLATLARDGHSQRIVSAKLRSAVERVLAHFNIAHFFDAVHAPGPEQRACDKADLVAAALRASGAQPRHAVMIGDHVDDIVAARVNGVPGIAVGWGYGRRDALREAQPVAVVERAGELLEVIARLSEFEVRAHEPEQAQEDR